MFSVNQEAVRIVREKIIPRAEELNCKVIRLANGATVIDMGVEVPGGWLAGQLFVEATIGGLGQACFGRFSLGAIDLPSIDVYIDHPQEACLSSQFSGWKLPGKDIPGYIIPIGSGPARAIARNDIFAQAWSYKDIHHAAVFAAQTTELPDASLAESIAEACQIPVENVYILAARTGSLVGSIQVCSRTVEASMWRMVRKGFDISKVISGMGSCPIPPPIRDELKAMDRTNTSLLYGGMVRYVVDCTDEEIEQVIDQLPLSASRLFGTPFLELFEAADRDFYKVDKDIHTIAFYEIMNVSSGRTFRAGQLREDMLKQSLFD
ncbi:MAG: methenyltetrahydromethanopterin cyclohydrolase [Thermoanaerobacteraceae bacterium]|nr:methenyltetrahydromethanopterin cyclohydrolase [Thermoanaerobacteraceae bacterium]